MRIAGFDVSSSTIGWCILDIDGYGNITPIKISHYKPPKDGNIFERLIETKKVISSIIKEYNPDEIAIEEIIQYMGGGSTAKTIIMLTSFNRMVGLAAYEYLNKAPSMYSVMTIRHGLKTSKKLPQKEDMPKLVAKHLKFKFPYIYETKKRSKKKSIAVESYDMSDGMAVGLYHAFLLTGKLKKKASKK